ncbi:hypothetical protein C8Q79DRAFT_99458 [Trametes meyenii]|nr:hypothetical protein C8Q79DRAFT_99458 [Trametes meyenii]
MVKVVVPHMAARKRGTMVNVGPIGSEISSPRGGISPTWPTRSLSSLNLSSLKLMSPSLPAASSGALLQTRCKTLSTLRAAPLPRASTAILLSFTSVKTKARRRYRPYAQQVATAVLKPCTRYMTLASMSGLLAFWSGSGINGCLARSGGGGAKGRDRQHRNATNRVGNAP